MTQNNIEVIIKNMVCNRCIKVIRQELIKNKIDFVRVDFGKIYFDHNFDIKEKNTLNEVLKKEGFEIVESKEAKIVNQIKGLIIEVIHHGKEKPPNQNFSDFLVDNIGKDYSHLSKLFSQTEGRTIQNYIIAHKIERTKELLIYDGLSLSEISYELEYSSPQHLSRQFRQVTGTTPSEFKKMGGRRKIDTI